MADNFGDWRKRLRHRLIQQLPHGTANDAEVERRFQSILKYEVPSDSELVAMQERGELPTDEELARQWE